MPDESQNETVRIDSPLSSAARPSDANVKPRETVRINLPIREPVREPVDKPGPAGGSPAQDLAFGHLSQPANPPSFSPPLSASVMPAPDSPVSGPKKETARMPPIPDPLPSADLIKNTQSVIAMPHVVPQNALIDAAVAREKSSMLLSWILLGVSALILIIQIWTYFS
jgi:hypothetical protein